jgi:hypothetical protein
MLVFVRRPVLTRYALVSLLSLCFLPFLVCVRASASLGCACVSALCVFVRVCLASLCGAM